MSNSFVMPSPVGNLFIETNNNTIIGLEFNTRKPLTRRKLSDAQQRIKQRLKAYFACPTKQFKFNIELAGTDFQKKVWQILQNIPAGVVKTYGQVADELNSSARAVGNACRANPIPLIVPCHRVVAKNGIGGFSGKTHGLTIQRKRWLLAHEGVHI